MQSYNWSNAFCGSTCTKAFSRLSGFKNKCRRIFFSRKKHLFPIYYPDFEGQPIYIFFSSLFKYIKEETVSSVTYFLPFSEIYGDEGLIFFLFLKKLLCSSRNPSLYTRIRIVPADENKVWETDHYISNLKRKRKKIWRPQHQLWSVLSTKTEKLGLSNSLVKNSIVNISIFIFFVII
jgi:hypothetical protein